jgi:hypothetical protein
MLWIEAHCFDCGICLHVLTRYWRTDAAGFGDAVMRYDRGDCDERVSKY